MNGYAINELTTVYKKDTSSKQGLTPEEDIYDWITKTFKDGTPMNLLLYINKEKARKGAISSGISPMVFDILESLPDSIPDENNLAKLIQSQQTQENYHQIIGKQGASNLDSRDGSTSRMDNLRIAQNMEREGHSPKTLWAATGWMRGVDGEWRHEIPDAKFKPKYRKAIKNINPQSPETFERLKFKAQGRDFDNEDAADKEIQQAFHTAKTVQELQKLVADIHKKYNIPMDADNLPVDLDNLSPDERKQFLELDDILHNSTLRNIFNAPELFAAYPDLANIPVIIDEIGDDKTYAFYDPSENTITLNINHLKKLKELRNTIIHETQHAIQSIEGFAKGSNEDMFKSKANSNGEVVINPFLRKSFKRQEKLIFDSLTPELQKLFRSLKRKESSLSPDEFANLLDTSLSDNDKRRYSLWRYAQNGLANLDDNNPKTLQTPYMAYFATAGEVEARNAETRSNWREKRRLNTPLNESEFDGHGGEIQQEFRLVMDNYGKAYRQYHLISPEQIERFNQLAYTGTGNIIRGNKFDLRFVGSNEGGAMFGYGAYLAEVKKVAGNYRGFALSDEDLRGNTVITLKNGQSFSINENSQWQNPAVGRALFQISHYLKNSPEATNEQVISGVREDYKYLIKHNPRDKELVKRLKEELHIINSISELQRTAPKKGNIYSFDIPEDYELLDWDAELDNQPPKVKAGIQKLFDVLETLGFSQDDLRNYSRYIGELETGEDLYTAVVGAMREYLAQNPNPQDGITRADARASLLFNQAGIPGHRYFDRDSRGKQKGTHNFVIWDTDRMKMLGVEGDEEAINHFNETRNQSSNGESYNQQAIDANELSPEGRKQLEDVRKQYQGSSEWMKAPNGKKTNLTEQQWLQVRTPNFLNWFGDWINDPDNASKVLDDNGEPLVVYHGSKHFGFSEFDTTNGAWFSDSLDTSDTYDTSGSYSVFLNIRNPLIVDYEGKGSLDDGNEPPAHWLENSRAHDGVICLNIKDRGDYLGGYAEQDENGFYTDFYEDNVYGVKNPEQIKSATANNGNFDTNDAEIYHQIGVKRKNEMNAALTRRRPDMSPEQRKNAINEIEKLGETVRQGGNPKVEKIATKWLLDGHIILPEDNYKILDAIKICEQQHLDPMRFDDPNTILAQYTIKETKASRRINPDNVTEFSHKVAYPNGITVYTVDNSRDGQAAVRSIIDTHWGEDANPWCLAARTDEDDYELSKAWNYWNNYDTVDKRIAFYNGKLTAFCASDTEDITWWDREDEPHTNEIPYMVKRNGITYEYIYNEETGKSTKIMEKLPDGTTHEWYEDGQLATEELPDGTTRYWHENGQLSREKLPDGTIRQWFENGQLQFEELPDRTEHSWYENGQLKKEKLADGTIHLWHENGNRQGEILPDRTIREWYENAQLKKEDLPNGTKHEWYEDGKQKYETLPDGTNRTWYENGQLEFEYLPDGTTREWFKDGSPKHEFLPDRTEHQWFENGQLQYEVLPDKTIHEWYEDGKQKYEALPDGTTRKWYKDGKPESEKLPDGTRRLWLEDGKQKYEKLPDGTERRWYENGNKEYENLPNQSTRKWYENGQIKSERLADKTFREWYPNGQRQTERLADGTRREWYDNGQLEKEILPGHEWRGWYKNGQLEYENLPDRSRREWNENGQLQYERLADGEERYYQTANNHNQEATDYFNRTKQQQENGFINSAMLETFNQYAYHGTGNIILGNKFNLHYKGSNEGGAAFGHGAYLAQSKKVPETYRRYSLKRGGLGDIHITTKDGKTFDNTEHHFWGNQIDEISLSVLNELEMAIRDASINSKIRNFKRVKSELSKSLRQDLKSLQKSLQDGINANLHEDNLQPVREAIQILKEKIDFLRSIQDIVVDPKRKGNIYTFDVPEDYELLDWDAPLSEQPEQISKAIQEAVDLLKNNHAKAIALRFARFTQNPEKSAPKLQRLISSIERKFYNIYSFRNLPEFPKLRRILKSQEILEDLRFAVAQNYRFNETSATGEKLYWALADILGSDEAASDYLNNLGIPGHRFWDRGSRDAKQGTHNFVIWNMDKLKMLAVEGDKDAEEYFRKIQQAQAQAQENSKTESYNQQVLRADEDNLSPEGLEQIEKVRRQYEGTDKWLKAPNGKKSNLSERQWLQVRTENFKRWFGDWENDPEHASKVVDNNGEPLVVWHGTTKGGFSVFKTEGLFKTEGTGAFFSSTRKGAEHYLDGKPEINQNLYPVFLNIRNPYEYYAKGKRWDNLAEIWINDDFSEPIYHKKDGSPFLDYDDAYNYMKNVLEPEDAKNRDEDEIIEAPRYTIHYNDEFRYTDDIIRGVWSGDVGDEDEIYDGVIFRDIRDPYEKIDEFIVPTPENIKSATANNGNFSPSENEIYQQIISLAGAKKLDYLEGVRTRGNNLKLAVQMMKKGLAPKDIWLATGWELGVDGKWRYEIPDGTIIQDNWKNFINGVIKNGNTDIPLHKVFNAPQIFMVYPELKDIALTIDNRLNNGVIAKYSPPVEFDKSGLILEPDYNMPDIKANITVDYNFAVEHDISELAPAIIHELQHAIQDIEGFAEGGIVDEDKEKTIRQRVLDILNSGPVQYRKTLRQIANDTLHENFASARKLAASLPENEYKKALQIMKIHAELFDVINAYRNLAGEVEARNAETRYSWSDVKKRNTPLSESEDVPRKKQIVKQRNSKQSFLTPQKLERFNQLMYHGSKNILLGNRFNLKYLSTGEGGQAFGYGIYLAQNKIVGETYRTAGMSKYDKDNTQFTLKDGRIIMSENLLDEVTKNKKLSQDDDALNLSVFIAELQGIGRFHSSIQEAVEYFLDRASEAEHRKLGTDKGKYRNYLEKLIEPYIPVNVSKTKNSIKGNLYYFDGPEDFQLLDWDAKISEQPEQVHEALKRGGLIVDENETGEQLYRRLQNQFKEENNNSWDKAEMLASQKLNELGIPGHRFWDRMSRDAKSGTHNFVIWNTDTLRLLGLSDDSDQEAQDYFRAENLYQDELDSLDNDSDVIDYSNGDYEQDISRLDDFANDRLDAQDDDGFSEVYNQAMTDSSEFDNSEAIRQLEKVRRQYEGTDKWLKAPNGKDTNLTELQWLQVRTENFKNWFGDWENDPDNASKIVDENGEPLVVYRGEKPPIWNMPKLPGIIKNQASWKKEPGSFFTTNLKSARTYTAYANNVLKSDFAFDDDLIYQVFLNIRNPYIFEGNGKEWDKLETHIVIADRKNNILHRGFKDYEEARKFFTENYIGAELEEAIRKIYDHQEEILDTLDEEEILKKLQALREEYENELDEDEDYEFDEDNERVKIEEEEVLKRLSPEERELLDKYSEIRRKYRVDSYTRNTDTIVQEVARGMRGTAPNGEQYDGIIFKNIYDNIDVLAHY